MNLAVSFFKLSLLYNYAANEVIDIIFVYCLNFIFGVVTENLLSNRIKCISRRQS